MSLTRKERITGWLAKWIVVNIACRINAVAVLSLCVEAARTYHDRLNELNGG